MLASASLVLGVGCQDTARFPKIQLRTAQKAAELSETPAMGATVRTRIAVIHRWPAGTDRTSEKLYQTPISNELSQRKPMMTNQMMNGAGSGRKLCPDINSQA